MRLGLFPLCAFRCKRTILLEHCTVPHVLYCGVVLHSSTSVSSWYQLQYGLKRPVSACLPAYNVHMYSTSVVNCHSLDTSVWRLTTGG
jgi:hypothetical protein